MHSRVPAGDYVIKSEGQADQTLQVRDIADAGETHCTQTGI